MHKNPENMNEIRENLAEAAYAAWTDKTFVPRAVVVVNAMGKMISSVAVEIKGAEINSERVNSSFLQNKAPAVNIGGRQKAGEIAV